MVNEDKLKALDAAISNIEKQFGRGLVTARHSHLSQNSHTLQNMHS